MEKSDYDETTALAQLPNLDIEIRHRRPWEGGEEMVAITLRARPSFDALFNLSEAGNPMLFWMRAMEAAWSPWLRLMNPPRPPELGRDDKSAR
ncbi:hypothetical protein [Methylocapsa palsarum]|uniref:Uncharacterized protein n=1 Tax=Methylocapsa palsarum TaxID=1612308 RepID=A0A1I4A9D2_9HYPH|nr:hypothetical protein [Methylocapsa palsarum]SFK52770.1 hypothetical protein SAMN05444581_109148 [Methylocapsa palsarum]